MLLSVLTLLTVATGWTPAGDLFVGPGAPFAEIQPAIDAALPGDTVHVAPGEYDVFVLTKPIALLGAGSDAVLVRDPDGPLGSVVSGLPAGSETIVSGMRLAGPTTSTSSPPDRLTVVACAGRVTLHDIATETATPQKFSPHVVVVDGCDQVVLSHAKLVGTSTGPKGQIPLSIIQGSRVWVIGSELRAGDGPLVGFQGVPAVLVGGATLHIARSVVIGGRGSLINLLGSGYHAGSGGAAIQFGSGVKCEVAGGPGNLLRGGAPSPMTPPPGGFIAGVMPGAPVIFDPAALLFGTPGGEMRVASDVVLEPGLSATGAAGPILDPPLGQLSIEATERSTILSAHPRPAAGTSTTLELAGPPASVQLIHASPTSADALTTPFGTLMLPRSAVHLASSTLDAAGSAALPLSIPASPVLVGKRVWFQSVSIGAADIALSSPSLIVVAP